MKFNQEVLIKVKKETEDAKLKKYRRFELKTRNNYRLDEVVSALQKSIRRGQEERALFFCYELIHSNFIAYFWRRMSIICVEDVGLANVEAINVINSLTQLNERVNRNGFIESFHPTMAVLYLCRSPKSREIDYANDWIDRRTETGYREKIEIQDLDEHNEAGRERIKKLEGNYQRNKDEVFYYESILLNKPVNIEENKYKKRVWELRDLDKSKLNKKYSTKEKT